MKRVIVESPYAGDVERNLEYLRACMHDCLMRGEAPFASHALYTQPGVLDDNISQQRDLGIAAGFAWRNVAHVTVVYTDLGVSRGMQYGIDHAKRNGLAIEFRSLAGKWAEIGMREGHIGFSTHYCRLTNPQGSEHGMCSCSSPSACMFKQPIKETKKAPTSR
jgi:hypothetical protein